MNNFKKLMLAASLAVAGISSVHAAPVSKEEDTVFVLQNSNAGTGDDPTGDYVVTNMGIDAALKPVQPRIANDTFVDDFLLQIFDSQDLTLYVTALSKVVHGAATPGVTFSSISVQDLTGGSYGSYSDPLGFLTFSGSLGTLTSGLYDIQIDGTINVNGGTYLGDLGTVPTVPEPTNWALMLAGLGAMGAVARRRNKA